MNKSKDVPEQAAEEEVQEPTPLAIIPPGPSMTGAAPHLSKEILQGIATGFLQIQPEAASAALLDQDNEDDESQN